MADWMYDDASLTSHYACVARSISISGNIFDLYISQFLYKNVVIYAVGK